MTTFVIHEKGSPMKKKPLIMLLTSILCIALLPAIAHAATPDVWDGSTASSLTGGGKSEDDPYLISTGAELKLLADNSRAAGLGSCYVKLTTDIVLNDGTFDKSGAFTKRGATTTSQPNEWLPMGEASWHIDGDGHSISGMYIKCNEEKAGLISKIKDSGYIRNLTIKDSYINSSHQSQSHTSYIGVFAGETSGTSLSDCAGENNIVVSSGYKATGGIVGFAWPGSVIGVHASGSIQGSGALGGIVGRSSGVTFKNCWNEMDIDNTSSYQSITQSGGIAALAEVSEFYNCANLGYLHGGSRVGGIAGEAPVKIKNCYSTSDISGIKEYGSRNYVATLAGRNSQNVTVQGCYAEDGADGLYDIGAEKEGSYVPHFTGKGNLGGGNDGELLAALNENLNSMDAEPNLNKWVLNSDGYPIPTGETFVDDTVYYDIWLDGVRVSERNEADILGDGLASYDKATSTLFLHDGLVVGLVGAAQLHGHGDFIVEVGEGAIGVERADVEDGLGGALNGGLLGVGGGGPGEVVVDDILGIAVTHFQTSTDGSHPCHVNVGGQDAKVVKGCVEYNLNGIGYNKCAVNVSHRNVSTILTGMAGNHNGRIRMVGFTESRGSQRQFLCACIRVALAHFGNFLHALHHQRHSFDDRRRDTL